MRLTCGFIALALTLFSAATAFANDGARVATLHVTGEKDHAEVSIAGGFAIPDYSIRPLDGGKQVVVEVAGAALADRGVDVRGTAALVVRTTASTTAKGVRVVVNLTRPAAYRAFSDRGRIRVVFDASEGAFASEERGSAKDPLEVKHVIIERRNGRDRVVAELSRPGQFRVLPGTGGPARLEITGAELRDDVLRHLEGDSSSVIRTVDVKRSAGRIVLEVDRKQGASTTAIREGNRIVWLFAAAEGDSEGVGGTRTVARQESVEIDGSEVAAFLSDVPMQIGGARQRRKYTGRRIDLDLKSADIHNILRLLSEVGNVNIITADDVAGSVTIKMKGVPWDQALDVILTAKGLGMVRRGNLLRVAPQATLEKEREMAIARQKQRIELAPLETRLIPVSYATANELKARASELLSERGTASVDTRTNILVVRDVAENLDNVEELVRSLDSQTPQVLIEARIVEATTSFTHQVGIQWGGSMVMSSATGNPTGLTFPSDLTVAGGATDGQTPTAGLSPFAAAVPNPNFVVNFPAPAGTGQGAALGLSLGSLAGNFNVAVRLSAFETSGHVRIISSPRILTLDNHAANIEQGTSIPYSQVSAQGVQTAFQEAKLSLNVTPHVTSDGAVQMDVAITRDEPDFNQTSARGDPTILKRSANTSLLVQDGHTAVIGGIYTRNTGRGLQQIPFFGDIPILGILFRQSQQRDARNELLIFLTPRIVNRSEALSR
ncbi:MAG: type IV pilus secretin PilQ [Myxococcales bacterium]|jgi:type IV pilus assembly protein PilQ